VSLSDSLCLTALRRVRVQIWQMKRYEARPRHSHGCHPTARMCQFLDSGDLDSPTAAHSPPLHSRPGPDGLTSGFDAGGSESLEVLTAGARS
jgi:hypothetical protein